MITERESREMTSMTEPTYGNAPSLHTRVRPMFSLASFVLLIAVLGMLPQGAFLTVGPTHAGAPVAVAHGVGVPALPPSAIAHLPASLQGTLLQHFRSTAVAPSLSPSDARFVGVNGLATTTEAAPGPAAAAANFLLGNSDCSSQGLFRGIPAQGGANIVQVGTNPNDLLASGGTQIGLFNQSGSTPCNSGGLITPYFLSYGYGVVYRSTDHGQTWTQNEINRNVTLWNTAGTIENGSMTTGTSVIAASDSGNAVEITGYAPPCLIFFGILNCSSAPGIQAPWGFGVTSSQDGGITWSNISQLDAETAVKWINFPASCAGVGLTSNYYYNNIPEDPWAAMSGSDAMVGWDVFHEGWDPANCTLFGQAFIQVAYSTDGGVTWGGPVNISNPVSESMSVAFGPTAGQAYSVFLDFGNATAANVFFGFTKTSNGGATWTSMKDITTAPINPTFATTAAAPDSFLAVLAPALAADNWSSSPHSGNVYLAWQDNQTGGNQGHPTIDFIMSSNGGTTWTAPAALPPANNAVSYVMPAVSVAPDGTVWVTYYTIGGSSGYYNVQGVYSTDGGATWSPQFTVTSTASQPGTGVQDIGFFMGSAATSAGLVPIWSDCRAVNCATNGDVTLYTANVSPLNISSTSVAPITATVTVFGAGTNLALPSHPAFDVGASVTVQVPQTVAIPGDPAHVDQFSGWTGESTSLNFITTLTYSGGANLVATYTAVPAAFIQGFVTPNVAGVALTLDSQPVTLTIYNTTTYQYFLSVSSGQSYYLNCSAPNYVTQNVIVPVTGGQTTWQNFTLVKKPGFITGSVTPRNANLNLSDGVTTVSENSAVNPTDGTFNLAVPFGTYWLNASLSGYTTQTCLGHAIVVIAGAAVVCTLSLTGGWINGTVTPAKTGLTVTINGVSVNNSFGAFSAPEPGGVYTVVSTQPGYNTSTIQNVRVIPGQGTFVNVSLTNHGWLAGIISPVAALKNLQFKIVNLTSGLGGFQVYDTNSGTYNVSLVGGYNWTVTASATGYNTTTVVVAIAAGDYKHQDLALNPSVTPPCTTNCPPKNTTENASSSSFPLVYVVLIVVVVLVVAVLVAVMMMRRGRGGGGGEAETNQPPEHLYEGSNPSDLPKLQQDGSMGGDPPSG
jgi:hypothetical protein